MDRLQVDVGETPVGDATRKWREWLHLHSADRQIGVRMLPDRESEKVTQRW